MQYLERSIAAAHQGGKPKILGAKKRGRPPNVSAASAALIVDVADKSDQDHKGKSPKELGERLSRLEPHLAPQQCANTLRRAILANAKKGKRLAGAIVASATTPKRAAITVDQQFRFHTMVEDVDQFC